MVGGAVRARAAAGRIGRHKKPMGRRTMPGRMTNGAIAQEGEHVAPRHQSAAVTT